MIKRRSFFRSLSGLFAGVGILGSTSLAAEPAAKNKFMHIVFFWLIDDRKGTIKGFEKSLTSFLKDVKEIRSYHIGTPANTPRTVVDNSYSYCLLVEFNSKEDHDIYQQHAAHKRFIEESEHLWTKVQVYDSIAI